MDYEEKPGTTAPGGMSEAEILNAVKSELDRAEAFLESKISVECAMAYDFYYGKLFGNEQDGRSQVVSGDVAQAIDSAVPALVKIFVSGDKAVEFTPRGPEDVQSAEQATLSANFCFFSQNNGYALAHDFIKDGLLLKRGVFKWKWDTSVTIQEKRYEGLDEGTIQILSQDPAVEIVEAEPVEAVDPQGQPITLYNVLCKQKKEAGKVKIIVPPPEEILISPDSEGLDVMEHPFIAHCPLVTKSELIEMGVPVEVIDELPQGESRILFSDEEIARKDRNDSAATLLDDTKNYNPAYRYNECYIRIDADGDGVAELRKICTVGDYILHNDAVDHIPLAIWTPKVMPHEVIGISLADDVMDIQLLKSTIWRGALDNLYLSIAPRIFAKGEVNLDDLLTVKPGGIIRGEANSDLMPVVVPSLMGDAFQMLEYADQEEEVRTGISRLFQGIDPQAINKTATGVNAIINQANARVELMARNAAEFGFKPLFKGILYLLAKHQNQSLMVRLTNKFVPVDPDTWSKEYDMSCNVGLGMGTKDQQLQQLMMLSQDMAMIAQSPFAQQLLDAKKVFNLQQKKAELAGFKDVSVFLNDPGTPGDPDYKEPPPPPKPPEIQKAEMQIQADQQKFQAQAQIDAQKMTAEQQAEAARMAQEAQLKQIELQQSAALEQFKIEKQAELEAFKIEKQAELERYKAELSAQTARETAHISGQSTVRAAYASAKMEDPEDDNVKAEKLREKEEGKALLLGIADLIARSNGPKEIVRGKDGRAIGVRPV